MKKALKVSSFFVIGTIIYYLVITTNWGCFMKQAPAPDQSMEMKEERKVRPYGDTARDFPAPPVIANKDIAKSGKWLDWAISAFLSLVTYFCKKSIDHFFFKKENPQKI
jgi:hypothetical protein